MGVAESTCDHPDTHSVHAYALRPLGGGSQSAIYGMRLFSNVNKVYAVPYPLHEGLDEWFRDASRVQWLQHNRRYAGRDNRRAAAWAASRCATCCISGCG